MPRRTKVNEVEECTKNEPIMYMTGKLVKLYGRRESKPGDRKQWSIQNGILRDETGEVKIMITDRDHAIPDSWKGQDIILEAHVGDRGASGLYAYDDDYDGKVTRIVKATKTAKIYLTNESGETDEEEAPPARQAQSQPRRSEPATRPAQREDEPHQGGGRRPAPREEYHEDEPPADPKPAEISPEVLDRNVSRAIFRDALLFNRCLAATLETIIPEFEAANNGVSEETIQKVATTLFLNSSRRGDADRIITPKKPVAPAEPEPVPVPAPAAKAEPQEPARPTSGPGSRGGTKKSGMSGTPPAHNGPGGVNDPDGDDIPF